MIGIIFIALLFGIILGTVRGSASKSVIRAFGVLDTIFLQIVNVIM